MTLCSSAACPALAGDAVAEGSLVQPLAEWPDGVTATAKAPLSFRDHAEYKCYTPEQYQAVAHFVVDARWLHGYALRLELVVLNQAAQAELVAQQHDLLRQQVDALERERTFMGGLYDEEHKLRLANQRKGAVGRWFLVAGNVVLGAAVVVLGVYSGVK